MSSWGIPQLQQNDLVSMKWMDKEIKDKDFSQRFLCKSESAARAGVGFPFCCLHKKNVSLQVKAAPVCFMHLHFLHRLIMLHSLFVFYPSLCLCGESASGGRSAESPPSRNSRHKLRFEARRLEKCAAEFGGSPRFFFVLYGVADASGEGMSGPSPSGCPPARRSPAGPASPVRSCSLKPELKHDVVIPAGETALALSGALSQRAAGVTVATPLHLHRPRRCSSAQRRLSPALFIDLQMWARPRRWSRNRFQGVFPRWMFQMSCAVRKSAPSGKIHRHLLCLCWTVSLLHPSLQRNQKFWFRDKCHVRSVCGVERPSGLCFHSFLMQNVYLVASYYSQLCFAPFDIPA